MRRIVNALILILLISLYGCNEREDRVIVIDGGSSTGGSGGETPNPDEIYPTLNPEYNMNTGAAETIEYDNGRYKLSGDGNYLSSTMVFYDKINDVTRPIENNIEGSFQGHVEFMQTHNILPAGNSEKNQPSLVPYRSGLVLLTTDTFYFSIRLKVVTGVKTLSLSMDPPHLIPEADNTKIDKEKVLYSNKTWSAFIPDNFMQPGMELHFEAVTQDNAVLPGVLRSSNIKFSSSSDVVYFFMNIGLFKDAVSFAAGKDYMTAEPVKAVTDYYQTVPFGKVVNAGYSPQRIDRVMMSDGNIYTSNSSLTNESLFNDVISGQLGSGVILSNKGVVYSNLLYDDVEDKDPLYMFTAHVDGYTEPLTNKKGVLLLNDTTGNEFSRLSGYNFGLEDDYKIAETVEGSIHGYNTGWGYDSYNNKLRGNLSWNDNGTSYNYKGYVIDGFNGIYGWQKDPMSGGVAESSISKYPLFTKLTAKGIQDYTSDRYILSYDKVNGSYKYIYWDNNLQKYRYVNDEIYLSKRPEPTETGVPVITVIGGYGNGKAVLYPYFRGNYGNVYESIFSSVMPLSRNYLKIDYESGLVKYVDLKENSYNILKKFHINISQSSKPVKVTLYLSGVENGNISIPASFSDTMASAGIAGRDYGYSMLVESDIEKLNNLLAGQTIDNYTLNNESIDIIKNLSFNNKLNVLQNNDIKNIAENYINQYRVIDKALIFMLWKEVDLNNGVQEAVKQLKDYLAGTNYKYQNYSGQQIKTINNEYRSKCIELKPANGQGLIYAGEGSCVSGKKEQLWYIDNFNRIRSVADSSLCMPYNMRANGLIYCNSSDVVKWKVSTRYTNKNVYENINAVGTCLDYAQGEGILAEWSCHGGDNQNFVERFKDTELSRYKGSAVKVGNKCINISDTYKVTTLNCPANADELNDNMTYHWFMDKKGRLHSSKYPAYCIEASSNMQNAVLCSDSTAQEWKVLSGTDNTVRYESVYYPGKCLDNDVNNGKFNIYNCHGDSNQKFSPLIAIDNSSALMFLSGDAMNKIDMYVVE